MSTQVLKNKKSTTQFKINFNSNFGQKQFKEHLNKEKCSTDRRLSKTHRDSNQNISKSPFGQQTKKNRLSKQKVNLKKQKQKKGQKQKPLKSKSKDKSLSNIKNKKYCQVSNNKKIHKKSQILTTSPNIITKYQTGSRSVSKSKSKSKSRSVSKSYKKQRSKSQISTSRLNTCRSTMQKPNLKKTKKKVTQKQKVQKTQKSTNINSNLKLRSRSRINTQRSCYSPLKQKNIFKNNNSNIQPNKLLNKKQKISKHQQSKSNLQSVNIQKTKQKNLNKQKKKQKKVKKQIKKDKESQNYKTIQNSSSKQTIKEGQNHKTVKQKLIVNQNVKIKNQQGQQTVSFKKRKNIEIKTQMSGQKQSYFDDSLLKRLQIFHQNCGDELKNCQQQINSSQISQAQLKNCIQNKNKNSDSQNSLANSSNVQQNSCQKSIQFLDHLKLKQNNTINSQQVQKINQLLKTQNQLKSLQNQNNQQLKQFQAINQTLEKIINNQQNYQENSQGSLRNKKISIQKIQLSLRLTNFKISKQESENQIQNQNQHEGQIRKQVELQQKQQEVHQINLQQIQKLRKEQEYKWKTILDQLNIIKNGDFKSQEKIDRIIKESQKNVIYLNQKSKIHASKVYQSPKKISQLMKKPRRSFQQQMETVKNISEKRLLKDLQMLDSFQNSREYDFLFQFNSNQNQDHIKSQDFINEQIPMKNNQTQFINEKSSIIVKKNNFFQEFQKEMDEYIIQSKKSQVANQKDKVKPIQYKFKQIQFQQNSSIQLQKNQHLFLYDFVENTLIMEFCQSLTKNKKMFHQVLFSINKNVINQNKPQSIIQPKLQKQIELQKFQEYLSKRIECTEEYCLILSKELMRYVKQNHLEFILKNINRSFGMKPLHTLKWMRSLVYGDDQNQQNQQQQQDSSKQPLQESKNQSEQQSSDPLQPIISTQILQEFNNHQNQFLFQQISEEQYFFNHAIYNCLNDMLDAYRPFGQQGRPIIPLLELPKIKVIDLILENVIKDFKQVISIRMGRFQFSIQEQPQRIVPQSYKKLDICISEQLQTKWKQFNLEDIMFQKKYVIAEHVIDQIFNSEMLMLVSRFQN